MTQHIHTHYTALYSSPNILTQVELSPAYMFGAAAEKVNPAQGIIVWLRVWWDWMCGSPKKTSSVDACVLSQAPLNREARQNARHRALKALPPARNFLPFFHYSPIHYGPIIGTKRSGIRPRQFMERLARFSVWGRVSIYGLRREGNIAQRRAQLNCYDHGYWHAPMAAHYFLHLWPD